MLTPALLQGRRLRHGVGEAAPAAAKRRQRCGMRTLRRVFVCVCALVCVCVCALVCWCACVWHAQWHLAHVVCDSLFARLSRLTRGQSVRGGDHGLWSACHRCFLFCWQSGSRGLSTPHPSSPWEVACFGCIAAVLGCRAAVICPVADVVCSVAFSGVSVAVLARREVRSTTLRVEGLRAVGGQPTGPPIAMAGVIADDRDGIGGSGCIVRQS